MSDLPTKQEYHPAHNIPPATQSYSNYVLSGSTPEDTKYGMKYADRDKARNKGQGPVSPDAEWSDD